MSEVGILERHLQQLFLPSYLLEYLFACRSFHTPFRVDLHKMFILFKLMVEDGNTGYIGVFTIPLVLHCFSYVFPMCILHRDLLTF